MEEDHPHVHKVNLSKRRTFAATLRSGIKETFFPEDPFRQFAGSSAGAKVCGALKYFLPILEWGPKYTLAEFWYDLLAGITLANLAIPQGISYARLAELPPVFGLYVSFVPALIYPIFGSSKNLAVGTLAASSLLLGTIIREKASPTEQTELYCSLFFTAAFFTGVFEAALGFFRLGILVDFLSRSTITGFMGGTAILVILQQFKGMLGMVHFTTKTDIVSVLHAIFQYRHEWRWESLVLGICFISFLMMTKNLKEKFPRLFWLSAASPLLVVILGCVLSYLIHGDKHGIPIVGPLKKGLNPVSIGDLTFKSEYLGTALKAGLITGFLGLAEGISVGKSLGILKKEQTDGNKEMIAFGMMNIIGSFFSCYMTSGPFSKSAVNYHAGCKTAMSNVVMAGCMVLVLLFLAPLFKYTPLVALSAIIIVAMIGLIEYEKVVHLYEVDKFDFCICMAAFLGVVFSSMVVGLMLSMGLSIVRALLYVARPCTCRLGNITGTTIYCDIEQYPDAITHPGILILQLCGPISFVNVGYLRERILRWVNDEESINNLQYVILDMGGVTSADNMGIGILLEVHSILKRKEIKVALTNPRLEVVEKFVLSKYIELIGTDWVFLSINEAVSACRFVLQESKP